ncbi:MAG: hypothetical protein MUP97_14760 [Acidimicrobiia bacterium]|nr:hypothetical protein [Acidimicrobiia bacterium]
MRSFRKQVTVLVVTALVSSTAALAAAPAGAAKDGSGSVALDPLCVQGGADGEVGCTNPVTIHLSEGGSGFRVSFSEDEVGGTGDQWRAAGWNATTTATLLTGEALTGRKVEFEVTGEIDGGSAGALMTVGIMALLRGDKIRKNVTMTGAINPDGTVGPVAGIPLKVDGAVEAKKTVMLIPEGQRNSEDPNTGELVDVVDLGTDKGVEVKEVADVYEAYSELTGKQLPRLEGSDTDLSSDAYNKLESLTAAWGAEYNASDGEFGALDPTIQGLVAPIATQAVDAGERADQLGGAGVQAGAYTKAVEAAAFANAAVKTGQAYQIFLTQGADAFISQIQASASIEQKASAFFEGLKNVKPKTLSEAAGLIAAYGNAIDALALSSQGDALFEAAAEAATPDEAVASLVLGALYEEVAGTVIDSAKELQDFSSDLPGPPVKAASDVKVIADFFRKAAQANLDAFDSIVVTPLATENGVSDDVARSALAQQDFDYGLALNGSQTIGAAIDQFVKDKTSAAYADLGGATLLYARSAMLLAKYYSLQAKTDENGDIVAVRHEQALTNALEIGQDQAAGAISMLRSKKTDPALPASQFEVAGVEREGDLNQKFEALSDLYGAFVGARLLAYLGGFEKQGLT